MVIYLVQSKEIEQIKWDTNNHMNLLEEAQTMFKEYCVCSPKSYVRIVTAVMNPDYEQVDNGAEIINPEEQYIIHEVIQYKQARR
jgi:hypothetical protein